MGNTMQSGDSSMFPGFPKMMCSELHTSLRHTGCQLKLLATLDRSMAVRVEGSMAASLASSQHVWMGKEQYQQHGPGMHTGHSSRQMECSSAAEKPSLLQESKVDLNAPKELNCFPLVLQVVHGPIQHHCNMPTL